MDVNEAYDLVLSKLKELKESGIKVDIVHYDDVENASEYSLNPSKWIYAIITCRDLMQSSLMWNLKKELNDLGIHFATGARLTYENDTITPFYWQLDTSFYVD